MSKPDVARGRADLPELTLVPSRSGRLTLLAETNGGVVSLHSRFDPLGEAEILADKVTGGGTTLLVVLGGGLGYHAAAAASRRNPAAPTAIVEADPRIARLAKQEGVAADCPESVCWMTGLPMDQALQAITRLQAANGFPELEILAHQPSMRLYPDYYGPLAEKLARAADSPLTSKLVRPRFQEDRANILLIDTGYHLVREISRAAEQLGHKVVRLSLSGRGRARTEQMGRLLEAVAEFAPDFILTINHLGFDQGGVLTQLLENIKLPVASWFVDSPRLILEAGTANSAAGVSIFVWDRSYIAEIQALGFDRVHYLPLAADVSVFRPPKRGDTQCSSPAPEVAFVGDSMVRPVAEAWTDTGLPRSIETLVDDAARSFSHSSDISPEGTINRTELGNHPEVLGLDSFRRLSLEGLITWRATQMHRLAMVSVVAPLKPTIVGDDGWRDLLPPGLWNTIRRSATWKIFRDFTRRSK